STTPEIHTPSLHDALPISDEQDGNQHVAVAQADDDVGEAQAHARRVDGADDDADDADRRADDQRVACAVEERFVDQPDDVGAGPDRKSTRLNSSHVKISYA